jgi:hypothetical protein
MSVRHQWDHPHPEVLDREANNGARDSSVPIQT